MFSFPYPLMVSSAHIAYYNVIRQKAVISPWGQRKLQSIISGALYFYVWYQNFNIKNPHFSLDSKQRKWVPTCPYFKVLFKVNFKHLCLLEISPNPYFLRKYKIVKLYFINCFRSSANNNLYFYQNFKNIKLKLRFLVFIDKKEFSEWIFICVTCYVSILTTYKAHRAILE